MKYIIIFLLAVTTSCATVTKHFKQDCPAKNCFKVTISDGHDFPMYTGYVDTTGISDILNKVLYKVPDHRIPTH